MSIKSLIERYSLKTYAFTYDFSTFVAVIGVEDTHTFSDIYAADYFIGHSFHVLNVNICEKGRKTEVFFMPEVKVRRTSYSLICGIFS